MTSSNLLITGATGYIGFHVLLNPLEAGYNVRITSRSSSKSKSILSNPKIQKFASENKISFIEIPDIAAPGAFDDALKDQNYVIHVGSPLPHQTDDPHRDIYEVTFNGMKNILDSALKTPSIKRVIITNSIVGNFPMPPPLDVTYTEESREPIREGPFTDIFGAYGASKIASVNYADSFVEKNNAAFDVVTLFPGMVYGPDQMITDLSTAIESLTRDLGTRRAFGATATMSYDDIAGILEKNFPKEIEDGTLKAGTVSDIPVNWDASKTEEVFGLKFKTFEDMIVDFTSSYLALSQKA